MKDLVPHWMQGMKGFFISGQKYLAIQSHSKYYITATIEKLKSSHPIALLSVGNLSALFAMMDVGGEEAVSALANWV